MYLSQNQDPLDSVRKIPLLGDNFGLTSSEFQHTVDNLRSGDDEIILKSMTNQLPESMRYLCSKFQIPRETAYDVCMDTFLEFREKLVKGKIKYGNLRYLFTRMSVNNYLDQMKNRNKIGEAVESFQKEIQADPTNKETFFKQLDAVVSDLSDEQRSLIKDIYGSGLSLEQIAEKNNITYPNIRKKKERLIKKIREKFQVLKANK